mgnify:CR=1 FL=1
MTDAFADAVESKVETSAEVNGWRHGPAHICEQAIEETVDIAAWLRGLDEFEKPAGAEDLIATVTGDAALLFEAVGRLKGMYGET